MYCAWTGHSQLSLQLCDQERRGSRAGGVQVTDLGQVLHMVGGTAASYMIFFLPGMLLLNAAIVKRTASMADFESAQVGLLPAYACANLNFGSLSFRTQASGALQLLYRRQKLCGCPHMGCVWRVHGFHGQTCFGTERQ